MNKPLSPQGEKLLLEIARCEHFCNFASQKSFNDRCKNILDSQNHAQLPQPLPDNYHLPEPWNGNIEQARVLFISSNPGINEKEMFPTYADINNPGFIVDFFLNRFDKNKKWTNDRCVQLRAGGYGRKVHYWGEIWGRVKEIHSLDPKFESNELLFGEYSAITEVVHCKSSNKKGVKGAIEVCGSYIDRILKIAENIAVVVLVDSDVISYFNLKIFMNYDKRIRLYTKSNIFPSEICDPMVPNVFSLKLDGRKSELLFISLGTANSAVPRKIQCWTEDKKMEVKKFLANH